MVYNASVFAVPRLGCFLGGGCVLCNQHHSRCSPLMMRSGSARLHRFSATFNIQFLPSRDPPFLLPFAAAPLHLRNIMTTPKPSKTNSTEEDRLRRDEILMKKLRISHEPETTSDEWPVNLRNTFQSIVTLGSLKAQSYDDDVLPLHITPAWRQETKLRAKQLSDTARRLLKEKPSELTWRLEIEKLVDARFSLRTEWYVPFHLTSNSVQC